MNNLIGIYEKAFSDEFSLEKKCEIANKIGFDFIELSIDESEARQKRLNYSETEIKNIARLFMKYNLSIQSLCLSAHRGNPFGSKSVITRQKAYDIIEKAIMFAKTLGVRNIQLAGYDVFYEPSDIETEKNFIEGLKYCAKLAEANQIMISIEIMDTEFIGTIANGKKYIDIVNSPWLKLYVDIGNLYRHSFDIYQELSVFKNEIVQVHIKDTRDEIYRDLNLGEGDVPIKAVLKEFKKLQYNGPYVIEIWNTDGGEECVENIQQNFEYFLNANV